MLKPYLISLPFGADYAGQASALSAVVTDTRGNIVATVTTFAEPSPGEYEATINIDSAISAYIDYTWTGAPVAPFLAPDVVLPSGLAPGTPYAYPGTVGLGPDYAGQASALAGTLYDTIGTVLATLGPWTEVHPGDYRAQPTFNASWAGRIRYAWTGTPAIDAADIGTDTVNPTTDAGSSAGSLTSLDLDNVEARALAALGAFPLLQYNRNLIPAVAVKPSTRLNTIADDLVPGTDVTLDRTFIGQDALTTFTDMYFALRSGSPAAPITNLADRHITPTLSSYGQILDPGTTTQYGTVTTKGRFIWSRAETALIAPGANLAYYITGTDSTGKVHELDSGQWNAQLGGPLG